MRTFATSALIVGCVGAAPAQAGTIVGTVVDRDTRAPIADVTVAASDGERQQVAITDGDGRFALDVPAGDYTLTCFYGPFSAARPNVRVTDDAPTQITLSQRFAGDVDDDAPPPPAPVPAWIATAPLVARRDHLGLAEIGRAHV